MRSTTSVVAAAFAGVPAKARIETYDWQALGQKLDGFGCAVLPKLLSPVECRAIAGLYPAEEHFRSHVHMARHGFGKGEYRYFKYPLPDLLHDLRTALYPRLVDVANEWNQRMGIGERYPIAHASFLKQCHDAGQPRPTPLLLQYVPGDFNCLHQDLYGDLFFPIQVAILLSEPGVDFSGGEFAGGDIAPSKPNERRIEMTIALEMLSAPDRRSSASLPDWSASIRVCRRDKGHTSP